MSVQILRPTDDTAWHALRRMDLTASQIGALFGAHEYVSMFDLWALKTGRIKADPEQTPAMERGTLLEPVAVELLRRRNHTWTINYSSAERVYYRDPVHRLGATPDVLVEHPERGLGVVQIKSVEPSVFRRKWKDESGEIEPPLWIALQASMEADLVGAEWAAVAAILVGHGLDLPLIDVPLLPGVMDAIRAKAGEFWRMIAEGREPAPDFARDGDTIAALYAQETPGKTIDLSGDNYFTDLVHKHRTLKDSAKDIAEQIEFINNEIKAKMGDAEVAILPDGRRVTWRLQKRRGYTVAPSESRVLRYPQAERGGL